MLSSSETLSPEKVKLTEQDLNLIAQAQDDFNKRCYDKCLDSLCQLEQSMGPSQKIQHNKCIAEYYKSDCRNHEQLLQILESELFEAFSDNRQLEDILLIESTNN